MDNKNNSSDQTLNHVDDSNEKIHYPMKVTVMDDSSETETEEEEKVKKNEKKEEEQDKQKQRKHISAPVLNVQQVTPTRANRAHEHHTDAVTSLTPAATLTPKPIPSDMFPPPQLPKVQSNLQLETELNMVLATTSPVISPLLITISRPTSPLPELDLTINFVECFNSDERPPATSAEDETTNFDTIEAMEALFIIELPDFTDADVEAIL